MYEAPGGVATNYFPTKVVVKGLMACHALMPCPQRGAATKCVGIQNMARGLPHSVSPLPYFVPLVIYELIIKISLCTLWLSI